MIRPDKGYPNSGAVFVGSRRIDLAYTVPASFRSPYLIHLRWIATAFCVMAYSPHFPAAKCNVWREVLEGTSLARSKAAFLATRSIANSRGWERNEHTHADTASPRTYRPELHFWPFRFPARRNSGSRCRPQTSTERANGAAASRLFALISDVHAWLRFERPCLLGQ
jgi:hypothetical protein